MYIQKSAHKCKLDVISQTQFVVQLLSCVWLCNLMDCSMSGFPVLHHLLELAQTQVLRVGDIIQPSRPLLSLLLPSIFPSTKVFSSESALCIRWLMYWRCIISPSSEYSGVISFRMRWFDLADLQESLKSLLQHHSSKASVLQCSAFFMVQLWHPYMTTGKTITLLDEPLSTK